MSNFSFWNNKRVCITGGAALIGSHLAEKILIENPAAIWIVDDLSSGILNNIPAYVNFIKGDLRDYNFARRALKSADIVIHLACAHGGRTFVDTHAVEMFQNLELDASVFRACQENRVEKVVYMSSACAYPIEIQKDINHEFKLKEDFLDYNNTLQPDGAYGFSKLAGELSLNAYSKTGIFNTAVVRGFTVYGPRMKENHAIAALIAKTFIKQEPFEIYGDGNQKRNWTFVDDTARGIKLVSEFGNYDVFNIGTEEVNTPLTACEVIWDYMDWRPQEIKFIPDMVGPLNRIADASKAKDLLGWEPTWSFKRGIADTVDWYIRSHNVIKTRNELTERMFSR